MLLDSRVECATDLALLRAADFERMAFTGEERASVAAWAGRHRDETPASDVREVRALALTSQCPCLAPKRVVVCVPSAPAGARRQCAGAR